METRRRPKPTTVAELHQVYREERYPKLRAQETFDFAWARLKPAFAHLRPDQIDRKATRAYAVAERGRGAGDALVRRQLGVLSAIIRYSLGSKYPLLIEYPAPVPPRDRYLTREEYRRLRRAARTTPHLWLFVFLAYRTGARATAVLELTWDRVDYRHAHIRLARVGERMKGRAVVPMVESTARVLRRRQRGALTPRVIEYGGASVASVKKAFARAVERAGLKDVSPHVLRHSAAVHMAESGIPMEEIADYLGHSDLRITRRVYARFSPTHLRRAASVLE